MSNSYKLESETLEMRDVDDQDMATARLDNLLTEHRDLDDVITRLSDGSPMDQLQLQRLKKRKLMLKDEIIKLKAYLLPDIIA